MVKKGSTEAGLALSWAQFCITHCLFRQYIDDAVKEQRQRGRHWEVLRKEAAIPDGPLDSPAGPTPGFAPRCPCGGSTEMRNSGSLEYLNNAARPYVGFNDNKPARAASASYFPESAAGTRIPKRLRACATSGGGCFPAEPQAQIGLHDGHAAAKRKPVGTGPGPVTLQKTQLRSPSATKFTNNDAFVGDNSLPCL